MLSVPAAGLTALRKRNNSQTPNCFSRAHARKIYCTASRNPDAKTAGAGRCPNLKVLDVGRAELTLRLGPRKKSQFFARGDEFTLRASGLLDTELADDACHVSGGDVV